MLEQGEIAELKFALACHERGYTASKPLRTSKYDIVVDVKGKLFRVQVKSAQKPSNPRTRVAYPVNLMHGGNRSAYRASDIDFFAIYLRELEAWYIIPVEYLIDTRVIHINPNRKRNQAGTKPLLDYSHFREAWHLFV